MKNFRWIFAISVLVFASLACQTLMGGATQSPSFPSQNGGDPPAVPDSSDEPGSTYGGGDSSNMKVDYPMPSDASNVFDLGDGTVTFQTKLGLEETLSFYQDELGKLGYTQDDIYTAVTDTAFSIVFSGDESGKKLVVQGVEFNGSTAVTLTLADF